MHVYMIINRSLIMLVLLVYVINLTCIVQGMNTTYGIAYEIEYNFVNADTLMREIVCPNHVASCANITTTYQQYRMNDTSSADTADEHCCACSCSQECHVLGNCCRDKLMTIPDYGEKITSEKDGTCMTTTWASPTNKAFAALRGAYLLVKTCPDAYYNQYVVSRCTQTSNFQSLTDLTPIYDEVRGLNYANIYCALCHNASVTSTLDHNIDESTPMSSLQLQTSWYTELECVNASATGILQDIKQSRDILDTIASDGFNDCFLRWRPNNPATECFHEDHIISTCFGKNGQNKHIPRVVELCYSMERNLYKTYENIYANFFCFLCNSKIDGQEICAADFLNQESGLYVDFIPFTLLIDFTRVDDKALAGTSFNSESNGNCEQQDVNIWQVECLQRACPPSTERIDGQCIPVVQLVKGTYLEFMLKMRYNVGDNFAWKLTSSDVMSDGAFVVAGNQPSELHSCWSTVTEDETSTPSSPTFIFHGSFMYSYTYIDPKETFERVKSSIGIINSLDRLHVELYDSTLKPLSINSFSHFSFLMDLEPMCGFMAIAMSDRQFCEAILLKHDQYSFTDGDVITVGSMIFAQREYVLRYDPDYEYVQICLDTYTQKMDQADTQAQTFNETLTAGNVTLTANNKLVFPVAVSIVTFGCTVASLVSLLVLIVTYVILKLYRSTPTLNTLMLSIHLLIAQSLFQFGILQIEITWVCESIGIATHYFWLVYICWTCVCTFHVFHRFVVATMRTGTEFSRKTLTKGMVFSYTCPFVFVSGNIVYSRMAYNTLGYGPDMCYISTPTMIGVTFALPIGILVGVNFLLFLILLLKLIRVKSEVAGRFPNRNQGIQQLKIYLRINTLTGSTWMFAFLYIWTKVRWLEYVFIVLNASNGVLIMLSFMTNDRIITQLKMAFNKPSTKVTKQIS